jgi:hypothetical protein
MHIPLCAVVFYRDDFFILFMYRRMLFLAKLYITDYRQEEEYNTIIIS